MLDYKNISVLQFVFGGIPRDFEGANFIALHLYNISNAASAYFVFYYERSRLYSASLVELSRVISITGAVLLSCYGQRRKCVRSSANQTPR